VPKNKGNEQKLAELMLYISEKCATDPTFGATKLNKILYWSDFLFYAYNDRGITDVEYQKLPYGPAPRRLAPVRDEMIANRELAIQEIPLKSGLKQKRTVNLRSADLSLFGGDEIAMVDQVIDSLHEIDAETTSKMSHEVGWWCAELGETISYNTVYFANPPLTPADRQRAKELKAKKKTPAAESKGRRQLNAVTA